VTDLTQFRNDHWILDHEINMVGSHDSRGIHESLLYMPDASICMLHHYNAGRILDPGFQKIVASQNIPLHHVN
jgi:hypothetical protein